MREKHREPEVLEEKVPVGEWVDGHARIISKELAPVHSVKSGTLQNACSTRPRVVANSGKSALMRIAGLMNNLVKRTTKNDDKSAVAMLKKHELQDRMGQPVVNVFSSNTRQLGCVFQDMEPPKSILQKSSDMQKPILRVKFTKAIARHTKIRDQNPSLGLICPGEPHQPSPKAPKFEDLRRRQSDKSKVPAKQRGSWPKVY